MELIWDKVWAKRIVSIAVTFLSLSTFIYKVMFPNDAIPIRTFWSIMFSAVGAGVFGAGIFWSRRWIEYAQLFLMSGVSVFTIGLNTEPLVGLIFFGASIVIAWGYDFFETYTIPKIIGTAAMLYFSLLFIYKDPKQSLLTTIGFLTCFGLICFVGLAKVMRSQIAAREAVSIAKDAIEDRDHGTGKS